MSAAYINSTGATLGQGGNFTFNPNWNTTLGNYFLVAIQLNGDYAGYPTITDNLGGGSTYFPIGSSIGNNNKLFFFLASAAASANSGSWTISVNTSGTPYRSYVFAEYSGINLAFAICGDMSSASTTTPTGGTMIPPDSRTYSIISVVGDRTGVNATFTAGTGFTVRSSNPTGANYSIYMQDQLNITGNKSIGATMGTANSWPMMAAAVYQTSSGGGGCKIVGSPIVG